MILIYNCMSQIRKLVIPVAGLGTRFLPATKAQPKEMLPVVDKPVIQYVVEDAVKSGITDIIMVTGPSKRAVEDHFSPNYDLISWLKKQGKHDVAENIEKIADLANFIFIRQKGPYGNGTPVLCAKDLIGDEPFAVVWGDEFFYAPKKPHIRQLIDVYETYQAPVLTACDVDDEGTKKYGIIEADVAAGRTLRVRKLVEKPGPDATSSRIACLGGYILTPDIFPALEKTKPGKDKEIWLPDAIAKLIAQKPVYAQRIEGVHYDTGSKIGYLKANVDFALRNDALRKEFRTYLKSVL